MSRFDILIIGGGPAAITIGKVIGRKKKVGIIRPENHSMIYCAMPYVIEDILPIEKTFKKDALVTECGASLIRDTATAIHFEDKTVQTLSGQRYGYDKLVIATGASPLLPKLDGCDLAGVMTFKTEADLRNIQAAAGDGMKKAVVVGAGAIGIELAQALNKIGKETHLVDMEAHILPNMMDREMVESAQQELIASGIRLHLDSGVAALNGKSHVEAVVLDNGTAIRFHAMDNCSEADRPEASGMIVFAVGMRPNVALVEDSAIEIGRDGIVVNEKMETGIPDVYAVGDCVQFKSGITREIVSGKLATNAVPMGKVLARNLLGESLVYRGFFNGAATKVQSRYVGGTGLSEKRARDKYDIVTGYAELTTTFPIMPGAQKVNMKLIADRQSRKIVGGQVVSGSPVADKVDLMTMAIQYGLTADDLIAFSYSSQPYQSFFPASNLVVAAAEDIRKKCQSE